jgi:hypothetical protein
MNPYKPPSHDNEIDDKVLVNDYRDMEFISLLFGLIIVLSAYIFSLLFGLSVVLIYLSMVFDLIT